MTKSCPSLIALHGFLGCPHDFEVLKLEHLSAINIFHTPITSLWAWAGQFNREVPQGSILLGYSMGGRLAMHCLFDRPELYRAAIIVAAHPGLKDEKKKETRYAQDVLWSEKFNSIPWSTLMEQWNNAPALKGSVPIKRLESDFDRDILARAMRHFSLGQQDYLLPQLNALNMPILWLMRDAEAENSDGLILAHPLSSKKSIAGSHRFLFEKPDYCAQEITNFIKNLTMAE